ncbi:LysR family transcriptional regulator [Pyxidicoccus fallax]|uniref:LysR family transcriptional regulator n=1 Tax=Pyxidicoccus fallax TaxID=394095 RepID=A0A848LEY5_9BACT|nr:LysR family transcriptional regulator [Pyxidicoccus fallax]NMO16832.1 LysR family transcriptional regulator [Pyxidicoccus fallax]NPC77573.1 LysR family transcriptional regulator [Pyxidicoccus fallax]
MDISKLDLHLLLALEALLEERNVTRAAERLQLSQPALSARLARLRSLFADPLFVPAAHGRGVVPTPRAAEMQSPLAEALAQLRRLMEGPGVFDPRQSRRTFVIAIRDNPAAILMPEFITQMMAVAPASRLALINPGRDIAERLETGKVDMLVGATDEVGGAMISRPLLEDRFLTAQRKGHPRGQGPIDLDTFCDLGHLLVSTDGGGFSGRVDAALAAKGRQRRVAVSVQSYALAPLILANSDCICTLPSRFLQRFARELDFSPPPPELELGRLSLAALWHPRHQDDPAHAWLREQLFEAARRS